MPAGSRRGTGGDRLSHVAGDGARGAGHGGGQIDGADTRGAALDLSLQSM